MTVTSHYGPLCTGGGGGGGSGGGGGKGGLLGLENTTN